MRLVLNLQIFDFSKEDLQKLLELDCSFQKTNRSTLEIKKNKEDLSLKITAVDPVAMKATINSVLKTIEIYSKTRELVK